MSEPSYGYTTGAATEPVILAAGGIVTRLAARGPEVLLIHRRRHGDWCLPKGKLRREESPESAALREVQEETGYAVRLGGFLGSVSYLVQGVPKVVLFWNMTPTGQTSPRDTEEVEDVAWLSLRRALERLDHEGERRLLREALGGTEDPGPIQAPGRWWRRLSLWWVSRTRHYRRLMRTYETFRVRLGERILQNPGGDTSWAIAARRLLAEVKGLAEQGDVEGAWHCLHAARRNDNYALSQQELEDRAHLLLLESEKLPGWRRKAIEGLLGPDERGHVQATPARLVSAQEIIDGHAENQYHKIWLLRDQLRNLLLISIAALVTLVALAAFSPVPIDSWPAWDSRMIVAVLLFGVLGASFSAARSVASASIHSRIPEQVANNWVTAARTVLGAGPGLAAYAFLQSEFLNLGPVSAAKLLAVAFIAGFSERLVMRVVESVAGKEKESRA